jgi:hypothetical protein
VENAVPKTYSIDILVRSSPDIIETALGSAFDFNPAFAIVVNDSSTKEIPSYGKHVSRRTTPDTMKDTFQIQHILGPAYAIVMVNNAGILGHVSTGISHHKNIIT